MPEHVEASLSLRTRRASVSIVPEGDGTSLLVAWENFLDGDRLSAAFQIHHPMGHESLGVVVPWSRRRFAYTCKDAGLPAQGRIRIGYRELAFESGAAFATGDFGRGLWPRRSTWHHGAACGRIVESSGDDDSSAHVLALNLGGTWTDGTGITENAIWIDGRLDKIPEELTWEINTNDIEAPWRIHARASDAVDLRFVPFARRVAAVDAVVLRYGVRQVFGHYSGNLRNRHGETIEVRDLFGWASEHRAIW